MTTHVRCMCKFLVEQICEHNIILFVDTVIETSWLNCCDLPTYTYCWLLV